MHTHTPKVTGIVLSSCTHHDNMKDSPRPIQVRSEQLNCTVKVNSSAQHTIHHAIAIISYENLSVSGFEVLVINSGVDVALVADKLNSSSGEQDIIHK